MTYWIGTILGSIELVLSFFILEGYKRAANKPIKLREFGTVVKESMLLKVSLLFILAYHIIFTLYNSLCISKGL
ncbi:hypothetical protein ADM90_06175 [Lysinibacillus macroides]|uniref:Uncharacterized protein n=1 Tax=Lysinibacillus macroides TaxID=33935 RepID=A0A0N0CWB2_9BACI|nr:hypothetical protein ADM90_06175 [Lysinibacillus macroides]